MPGATFARFATTVRGVSAAFLEAPWAEMEASQVAPVFTAPYLVFTNKTQARGDALPSMCSRMLALLGDHPGSKDIAQDAAANALLGGSDTVGPYPSLPCLPY
jgi:hypothetical protein